jgi:thiamine-phosphate pyrophosphorylase
MSEYTSGSILRIVDASANRAREGMRVVEDYARLILANEDVSSAAREIRHGVTRLLKDAVPGNSALAARDTEGDVGADPERFVAGTRAGVDDILISAFKRTQEALRSLAEFTRALSAEASAGFERLRYRSYDLEKTVLALCVPRAKLSAARLGVSVPAGISREAISRFVEAGAAVVILEGAGASARRFLDAAAAIRDLCRAAESLLIVAGRADVARAADAHGVLLGPDDLLTDDARTVVGSGALIGMVVGPVRAAGTGEDTGQGGPGIEWADFLVTDTAAPGAVPGGAHRRQTSTRPHFATGARTEEDVRSLQADGVERIILSCEDESSAAIVRRAAEALTDTA